MASIIFNQFVYNRKTVNSAQIKCKLLDLQFYETLCISNSSTGGLKHQKMTPILDKAKQLDHRALKSEITMQLILSGGYFTVGKNAITVLVLVITWWLMEMFYRKLQYWEMVYNL